jgi:hypothetical protein
MALLNLTDDEELTYTGELYRCEVCGHAFNSVHDGTLTTIRIDDADEAAFFCAVCSGEGEDR